MIPRYDVTKLPDLPEGWYYEPHSYDSNVLHIVCPERGAASIHFRDRSIDLGWCIPYKTSFYHYAGRGWKDQLVRAAIELLQQA